jgi:hypothetical protein
MRLVKEQRDHEQAEDAHRQVDAEHPTPGLRIRDSATRRRPESPLRPLSARRSLAESSTLRR